jgi:AraC family transcriptional regulator of adaptative response/methylated-DNA-[protein]-cysteine methyltransferase
MAADYEIEAYANDADCWRAVCERDCRADGKFVYAVVTTKVYCRPSCSSRQPRRENVRFFKEVGSAGAAGFRPCLRCTPCGPSQQQRQAALVASVCRRIDSSLETPSLEELANEAGLSPFYLHRLFKRLTGMTPRNYSAARKADRVKVELSAGSVVTQAIYAAGYGSSSRFYENARSRLGMSPKSYRSGGQSERIRFVVRQCSLGHVLVAATERGICDIRLGSEPQLLAKELRERFSKAQLEDGGPSFETTVQAVVARIEQPHGPSADLPLDVRGTAFQQRVWEALRHVPVGATATYAEVADQIGQPSATRAVAQACGANRIAVLIPCHRVIRSNGEDGGYRWGVDRKRTLLDREAENRS